MMTRLLARLRADAGGATAVEYGLVAGAAALIVLTAAWSLGDAFQTRFAEIAGGLGLAGEDESGRGILFGTRPGRD